MNINKKPVSMLQEMMVKRGTVPNYELIHNGGGTHQNIFTYRVTCVGLTASGTGRCKKDAKHEAAAAMLDAIAKHIGLPQLPPTPCESPVRTPLQMPLPARPKSPPNVPFRNTIGELQELCASNSLEDPVYKETGDVGPPHARIFTVQCLVSTFVEEGTATTKKQAKHEAARKMIERITNLFDDLTSDSIKDDNIKREQMASKIAMAKYPELSVYQNQETNKLKINWSLKIVNFHKRLKDSFDEDRRNNLMDQLEKLLSVIHPHENDIGNEKFTEVKQEFENILTSVDIQFHRFSFKNQTSKSLLIIGIVLNTAPDIHEIGLGKTEILAELRAIQNVVKSMIFFLQ